MSGGIRIELEDLPGALELEDFHARLALQDGGRLAAHRARAVLVRVTPTDLGQLRASWKVVERPTDLSSSMGTIAELINDAPHIAVVELGARPHAVSPEGWRAIYEWVRRKYRQVAGVYVFGGRGKMVPRERARSPAGRAKNGRFTKGESAGPFKGEDPRIEAITNSIVWKIRKRGQKPTLFVRNSMDDVRAVMNEELARALKKIAGKRKAPR